MSVELSVAEEMILYLREKLGKKLEHVSQRIGVSRQEIRKIEAKAKRKLRYPHLKHVN